jgi:uncharacterized protein (TIGR02001 family)
MQRGSPNPHKTRENPNDPPYPPRRIPHERRHRARARRRPRAFHWQHHPGLGFTQTRYQPTLQGGFDYASKSGFYVGNWNANVEQSLYNGASLEMDVYGGYKGTAGAMSYDVGAIYYAYPGSTGTKIDNKEVYFGIGFGPVTAKLFYSMDDYFSTQALFKGANAHVGVLSLKNGVANGLIGNSVTDYKVGLTKDISGWVLGLSYLTTSKKNYFTTGALSGVTKTAGDARALVSLAKTF